MSGSAGFLAKKNVYLVGSPKVGGAGDGKHKKNTATLNMGNIVEDWFY